jgi:RNA polymerase sigma factor (sigma-70 family)
MSGRARSPHPYAKRLAHPDVRAKILATIGTRVKKEDVADVLQQVFVRLLLSKALPEQHDELLAYAVVATRHTLIDHHRARRRGEARHDDGAEVDAIAVDGPPEAVLREELRQALALVKQEVDAGHIPADVLRWSEGLAAGKTINEIAAEEGRSPSSIKLGLKRARDHLRKKWPAYAVIGGAFAVLLVILHQSEPAIVSHPPPRSTESAPEPTTAPVVPSTPPQVQPAPTPVQSAPPRPPSRQQKAAAQSAREAAAFACSDSSFEACEKDLDRAKELDPSSEDRPDVKRMREAIQKAQQAR